MLGQEKPKALFSIKYFFKGEGGLSHKMTKCFPCFDEFSDGGQLSKKILLRYEILSKDIGRDIQMLH